MAECTTKSLGFASLGRKKIQADFAGGQLTSDAGSLLLREVDKRLGLIEAIDSCIPDPRDPRYVQHSQRSMLAQRIMAIALGYEDLNDHQTLRNDWLFQTVTERGIDPEQALASTPTLWRLEERVNQESMVKIAEVFVDLWLKSYQQPPTQIILDFDATDTPLYGQQENRFFHGYYDCYCYLPLYVFCGDQLLVPYLRPSKIDAARHSRGILKLLVDKIRRVFPDVQIIIRADSGFCRHKMMRWCDRNGIYYLLGIAKNPVLLEKAQPWTIPARWHHERTGQKQRLFGSFSYAAATWDRQRRVIIKAEHSSHGENPRFVVTNLPGEEQFLYDQVYCQRGDMENRIKEQQLYLFADRASSHDFRANQFRLILSSAAYVLMETLRREGLKNTKMAKAQAHTIRNKLLKVAAVIQVSTRRIVFHLASGYPYKELFVKLLSHLTRQPIPVFGFA